MRVNALVTCLALLLPRAATAQEGTWPRTFGTDGIDVVVHQPQVDRWTDCQVIEARAAVVVRRPDRDAVVGALSIVADTLTDQDEKVVVFENLLVTGLRFPDASASETAELTDIVKRSLPTRSLPMALEHVIAMMAEGGAGVRSVQGNLEPPPIRFSSEPAVLVITLGEPTLQAIAGTKLFYVTNTNWDLIFEPATSFYYLRFQDSWLFAKALVDGSWNPVPRGALPLDFSKFPPDEDWADVRAAVPGEKPALVPKVFVSSRPAELIQTEGAPKYRAVAGTSLLQVENTRSDLFYQGTEGIYFLLTSGRWFRAPSLSGPWSATTTELPADFAVIPESDPASRVLVSVPGTAAAEEAVLRAQVPTTASVNRSRISVAVSYDGEPQFLPIEGIGVSFAGNSPQDVFLVQGRYYLCSLGIWFESATPQGPWAVCDSVPPEIYLIPETHPKHNVTYVQVYDSSPETVVVGYTSGYSGSYVVSGVVMYGLGWWAYDDYWGDHYWWDDSYYHYHYNDHWYGYGGGSWYDNADGVWRREGWAYGPNGGIGGSGWYDPDTGAWARGGAAWGPYQARGFAEGYNPQTDTYAATRQGANAYGNWGQSVVTRDDKWARTGHVGNDQGTVAGFKTSEGGAGVVGRGDDGQGGLVRTGEGDLYAGRDGNVYRREEGQWQKHGDGGWQDVQPSGDRAGGRDGGRDGSNRADGSLRQQGGGDGQASSERLSRGTGFSRESARSAAQSRGYSAGSSSRASSWGSSQGTTRSLNHDSRARDRGSRSYDRSNGSRSNSWSGSSSRRSSGGMSRGGGGSRSSGSFGGGGGARRGGGGRRR